MINMGITDYFKTRLLNNRVEQYNTKRSYWGEMKDNLELMESILVLTCLMLFRQLLIKQ